MTETRKLQRLVQEIVRESELPRTLLAKDVEISRAAFEACLSGNRNPTSQSAEQLAAGLGRRATRLHHLAFVDVDIPRDAPVVSWAVGTNLLNR